MWVLNGFEWFWGLGGAGGGGTPFTANNEEGSADSSKPEGTPPGEGNYGVIFGTQMWYILMVFTMRSRDPNGGLILVAFGSLLRCLGGVRGFKRGVQRVPSSMIRKILGHRSLLRCLG